MKTADYWKGLNPIIEEEVAIDGNQKYDGGFVIKPHRQVTSDGK
jgi:hypothetical protein